MTAVREAFVVPLLLLTVALLGGVRLDAVVALVPPPLVAVVLGTLLVAVLVQSGAVAPSQFVSERRTPLENASGAVVLAALLGAAAQAFNVVTPESGLLHALFAAFFFLQLLTMLAGGGGAHHVLRSVAVLLAGACVLRWVVLETLYAPGSGTAKRVLTALVEGVSLGALGYTPHGSATGYLAFCAIVLFVTALWLLAPRRPPESALVRVERHTGELMLLVVIAAVSAGACRGSEARRADMPETPARSMRERALAAARVWQPPGRPVSEIDLAANPAGGFAADAVLTCRFVPKKVGGTSPKFDCELQGGEVVRVKYGSANPEPYAEVAATRLLAALGFPADRMYVVGRVRCRGCPPLPFQALRCLDTVGVEAACFGGGLDYSRWVDFDPAVVERHFEGDTIEASDGQGWAWYELDRIDPARGGSPRAEVDALRLMAVLLAHWDNKADNQRLVCAERIRPDGTCRKPVALVHDLGATFGPLKVDLGNWRRTRIWADPASCRISMAALPYHGGTFPDVTISEKGRRLLLGLLEQLTDRQLADLFTSSRITRYDQLAAAARGPAPWTSAFKEKIEQIREAGPCPE